jgi:hypothetical protein
VDPFAALDIFIDLIILEASIPSLSAENLPRPKYARMAVLASPGLPATVVVRMLVALDSSELNAVDSRRIFTEPCHANRYAN